MFKKNDVLKDVLVVGYTHDGMGVVRHEGMVIFVKYAIINQTLDIKVTKVDERIAYAIIIDHKMSKVKCEHYKLCGGCDIMHMNYDEQLEFKEIVVKDALRKFNIDTEVDKIISNSSPYRYRNKVLMPFVMDGKEIKLGFYKPRSHDVLPVNDCLIQSKLANEIKDYVCELLNEYCRETVYGDYNKKGNLRHLYLRESFTGEEIMVCFVTKTGHFGQQRMITKKLVNKFSQIKAVVVNENARDTSAVLGFKNHNLYNCNFIHETVMGNQYRLLPNAFFQVNTSQTNLLYQKAIEYADLSGDEVVLDAFCGVGSITLSLAKHAKHVTGIEIVKQAIDSANVNKKLNNITNVDFICNDIEKEIKNLKTPFDVVVVDPPRRGLEKNMINLLNKTKPKTIVYVSCNPATLGRDLQLLEDVYEIVVATPVDMFSQNHHVETVVKLVRKD